MKEINFSIFFIILVFISLVNPVDAVCIDNKVTVYTNIKDAVVTIQTPELDREKTLREGGTWDIGSGYTLTVQSINITTYVFPSKKGVTYSKATLVFKSYDSVLDNKVLSRGQTYTFDSIFSAKIDDIFSGMSIIGTNNPDYTTLTNIYFLSEPYYWRIPQSGTTSIISGDKWYWKSNYINFSEENRWKVSYDSIDGYLKPENENQTADGRNCIEFIGFYTGGVITITTNIAEASFTISGPGGYSKSGSGTSWNANNVMGGSYTVTFMDVSGYTTPITQTRTVTPSSETYFNATYTPLHAPTTPTPTSTSTPTSTPTSTSMPTTTASPGGEGATETNENKDYNYTIVMVALIGALATIIAAYFGYLATKKK
jgi:hypothetical protein